MDTTKDRENRVKLVFRAFDYDSSGAIDFKEFAAIQKAFTKSFDEEKCLKGFQRVDKDKSGTIDINEFVGFFRSQGLFDESFEKFDKLTTRYTEAALRGRANYYVEQSNTTQDSDAP